MRGCKVFFYHIQPNLLMVSQKETWKRRARAKTVIHSLKKQTQLHQHLKKSICLLKAWKQKLCAHKLNNQIKIHWLNKVQKKQWIYVYSQLSFCTAGGAVDRVVMLWSMVKVSWYIIVVWLLWRPATAQWIWEKQPQDKHIRARGQSELQVAITTIQPKTNKKKSLLLRNILLTVISQSQTS